MKKWLDIEYSNKAVTAHGGMALMKRFIDMTGINEYLEGYGLPEPGSNAGYKPLQIIQSFWLSVWLGANRFAHTSVLRYDKVLQKIFGWKRCPSNDTYRRFFQKFDLELSTNFFHDLGKWFFGNLPYDNLTLDVDSSVWTRYGRQQGATRGYNPKKRGRASHHPLLAFVAEMQMVANFWLRPGNTSSANNVLNFLEETFSILSGKVIGLLRADAGFYSNKVMNWLEGQSINYIIAIKMYPVLKLAIKERVKWTETAEGIWVGQMEYKGIDWQHSRRVVVVRQHIKARPKASGKLLFPDEVVYRNFRYSAFVTNMDLSAELVWELYRKRANAENHIKELEYDFGADNFCMQGFYATEAALRMVMMSYNLMALFKLAVLQEKVNQRLSTIRLNCFSIGSWVVKSGRKQVLKMSLAMRKRAWMDGLFLKSSNFHWAMAKA
jgi:DDE family transposase